MTDSMQSDDGGSTGRGRSSTLVNRNVTIRGRRTSLRLEPAMWDALQEIAQREGTTVHELCTQVDHDRRESTLTAAIRVYILGYYRAAATAHGHVLAGHGYPRSAPAGLSTGTQSAAVRRDRPDNDAPAQPSASRRS